MAGIGERDFGVNVRKALASKGISIYGIVALPDKNGSFLNSSRGYEVNDNGTGRIMTYFEVLEKAGYSVKFKTED